jgi:hypothetical protein
MTSHSAHHPSSYAGGRRPLDVIVGTPQREGDTPGDTPAAAVVRHPSAQGSSRGPIINPTTLDKAVFSFEISEPRPRAKAGHGGGEIEVRSVTLAIITWGHGGHRLVPTIIGPRINAEGLADARQTKRDSWPEARVGDPIYARVILEFYRAYPAYAHIPVAGGIVEGFR